MSPSLLQVILFVFAVVARQGSGLQARLQVNESLHSNQLSQLWEAKFVGETIASPVTPVVEVKKRQPLQLPMSDFVDAGQPQTTIQPALPVPVAVPVPESPAPVQDTVASMVPSVVPVLVDVLASAAAGIGGTDLAVVDTAAIDRIRYTMVRMQTVVAADVVWDRPWESPPDNVVVGSGFAVECEWCNGTGPIFFTNAHNIRNARTIQLQMPALGQTLFNAYVPLICNDFDLALIQLVDPAVFQKELAARNVSLQELKIEEVPMSVGMEVAAVGFPEGTSSLTMRRGIISGTEHIDTTVCYQSTAPIPRGNDGGPLLDLKTMHVLGVNFAPQLDSKDSNLLSVNYVVPTLHILKVLQKFKTMNHVPFNGSWVPHEELRVAPLAVRTVEANSALYALSEGCTSGVLISKIYNRSVLRLAEPPVEEQAFLVSVDNVSVDSSGLGQSAAFLRDPMRLESLFQLREDIDEPVIVKSCLKGNVTEHKVRMSWRSEYDAGIKKVTEAALNPQDVDFEAFAGVLVMQLTVNQINSLVAKYGIVSLGRWLDPDMLELGPKLIIADVGPGTYASRVLTPGMVIEKMNGKPASTLEEYRASFLPDNGTIWTLEVEHGTVLAVDFHDLLKNQVAEAGRLESSRYLLTNAVTHASTRLLTDTSAPVGLWAKEKPLENETIEAQPVLLEDRAHLKQDFPSQGSKSSCRGSIC